MRQADHPARRAARRAAPLAAALALGACAVSFPTEGGGRRVIGLVDMTIAPPPPDAPLAGETVTIRGLGLTLHALGGEGALALGWSEIRVAALRDDAVVLGAALLE